MCMHATRLKSQVQRLERERLASAFAVLELRYSMVLLATCQHFSAWLYTLSRFDGAYRQSETTVVV